MLVRLTAPSCPYVSSGIGFWSSDKLNVIKRQLNRSNCSHRSGRRQNPPRRHKSMIVHSSPVRFAVTQSLWPKQRGKINVSAVFASPCFTVSRRRRRTNKCQQSPKEKKICFTHSFSSLSSRDLPFSIRSRLRKIACTLKKEKAKLQIACPMWQEGALGMHRI